MIGIRGKDDRPEASCQWRLPNRQTVLTTNHPLLLGSLLLSLRDPFPVAARRLLGY